MVEKEILEAIEKFINYERIDGFEFKKIYEELYTEGRWTKTKEHVLHEENSGRYFQYYYEYNACEACEGSGEGFLKDSVIEVIPYTVEITQYKPID